MPDEDRLARIENKVDRLAEAMVTMARMEERMVTLFRRMDSYDANQSRVSDRVYALEKSGTATGVWGYIGDKLLWLCAGGFVAWMAKNGWK